MHYLLVDCNQFFVSCEQLFNPRLLKKPVVVLSSNDGCVVARSKEAKALGIPMGAPAYQYAALFKEKGVHLLSSNFALYADISCRVMQVLHDLSPHVEEYSVDEAFLASDGKDPIQEALEIQKRVVQWTGIPVSIGIGSTKTLAKVAGDLAKSAPSGVLALLDENTIDETLKKIAPSDVWGIGSRLNLALKSHGIFTAYDLKQASELWLKSHFSVFVMRTALELKGSACFSLEEIPAMRQSLTCSRSFGTRVTELADLEEALSTYVASAAEKLRREALVASHLSVFITTSPFLTHSRYSNVLTLNLPEPTSYTPELIQAAKSALAPLFRKGYLYKKVGVILGGIVPEETHQRDLFFSPSLTQEKGKKAMAVLDQINRKLDGDKVRFAAEGFTKKWQRKRENASPRYTTSWDELLTVEL